MKAWPVGLTDNNKTKYKITSYNVNHIELLNDKIKIKNDETISPYAKVISDYTEIPCGHCLGCRLDYGRQWADRCLFEMKEHDSNYFVTLTYTDKHLHINDYCIKETGECGQVSTLCKRDYQLFMKRLRKYFKGQKIRYFAAGEYGESGRAHYHAILFGLNLDDLVFYRFNDLNQPLYTSKTLEEIWENGYVVIAEANWQTCAYVAKYMLKKQKGVTSDIYNLYNFEPEFALMSRRPGIGRNFFEENNVSMFDTDCIFVPTPEGGKKIYPGRYYKKLFEAFDVDKYMEYKDKKLLVNRDFDRAKELLTTNNKLDMLLSEESARSSKVKHLNR